MYITPIVVIVVCIIVYMSDSCFANLFSFPFSSNSIVKLHFILLGVLWNSLDFVTSCKEASPLHIYLINEGPHVVFVQKFVGMTQTLAHFHSRSLTHGFSYTLSKYLPIFVFHFSLYNLLFVYFGLVIYYFFRFSTADIICSSKFVKHELVWSEGGHHGARDFVNCEQLTHQKAHMLVQIDWVVG